MKRPAKSAFWVSECCTVADHCRGRNSCRVDRTDLIFETLKLHSAHRIILIACLWRSLNQRLIYAKSDDRNGSSFPKLLDKCPIEALNEFLDDPEPTSSSDVRRSGSAVNDLTSNKGTRAPQTNSNLSASPRERMASCVRDKFVHDHS